MSDNKKYYYLKLKENFFESDSMMLLEKMADGYLYSNILLKLYLRSLKDNGRLMLNGKIPYNPEMLATVTRHSIGVIEKALDIFKKLELIEILDNGAIYMLDIQNFIGKSSTEADRQREYYSRIHSDKLSLNESEETCKKSYMNSTPEIEINTEIEKEIDNSISKDILVDPKLNSNIPYKEIINLFNSICIRLSKIRDIEGKRKKQVQALWKSKPDLKYFENLFKISSDSDFLCGINNKAWTANFDWIIKLDNRNKILEGNYKNKLKGEENGTNTNRPRKSYEIEQPDDGLLSYQRKRV